MKMLFICFNVLWNLTGLRQWVNELEVGLFGLARSPRLYIFLGQASLVTGLVNGFWLNLVDRLGQTRFHNIVLT